MLQDFLRSVKRHPGLRDCAWVLSHNDGRFVRDRGFVVDIGQPGYATMKTRSHQGFAISLLGRLHTLYPSLSPSLIADAYCPPTELPNPYLKDVIAVCAYKPSWVDYHVRPWLRWREIKRRMRDCGIVYTDVPPSHPVVSWISQTGRLVLSAEPFPGLPLSEQFLIPQENHRLHFSELTSDPRFYTELVRLQQAYFLRLAIDQPAYRNLDDTIWNL